jgi:hypothetical protein
MMFEFTIGINLTGKGESVTVGHSAAICVIHTGVDHRKAE